MKRYSELPEHVQKQYENSVDVSYHDDEEWTEDKVEHLKESIEESSYNQVASFYFDRHFYEAARFQSIADYYLEKWVHDRKAINSTIVLTAFNCPVMLYSIGTTISGQSDLLSIITSICLVLLMAILIYSYYKLKDYMKENKQREESYSLKAEYAYKNEQEKRIDDLKNSFNKKDPGSRTDMLVDMFEMAFDEKNKLLYERDVEEYKKKQINP